MKRAFVFLLVASMLSTSAVYAADGSQAIPEVSEYADEYSQSGSGDYCGQEECSDYGSDCDEAGGESETEAESADTDAGSYSDGESFDKSETAADGSGSEAESSSAESESDDEKDAVTENAETRSDSGKPEKEQTVVSKEINTESVSDSKDLKDDSGAVSKEAGTEGASKAKDLNREGGSDLKNDSSYDGSSSSGSEGEDSLENTEAPGEDAAVPDVLKLVPLVGQSAAGAGNSRKARIAIMSDIHYVTDQLISEIGRENLKDAATTEFRLMEEIDAILTAALEGASNAQPDALLICGDLISNGELLGARTLAEKLKAAKGKNGFANTGFYVVNGNHDINNSYAADFTGETVANADRIQPSEFSEVFSGLGYGDDDHWAGGSHSVYVPTGDDPSQVTNHGGLSYATDIADGITLIVLDTGIYRTDEDGQSMYNDAQRTAGYVSDDLLAWAAKQAKEARDKGNFVLAMSHHGLLPHYDTDLEDKAAWFMDSFRVPNWEKVADTLADAGVSAVLTGHTHANDITSHVSKNNNVIYDVETAALCAYPCLWRAFEIETNGEGEDKTYTISIDTAYINDDLKADTSSWSFTIGGETKTFDEDYNRNLQDYAYDKTGISEAMLDSAAMYMVKNTLSDIVNHKDGLAGFIKEKLGVPEDQSLGEYAAKSLRKVIDGFSGFTKSITTALIKGNVSFENITEEGDENPTFKVTAEMSGIAEQGKAMIDLGYIPTAVDELTAKTEKKLLEGDWIKNPYASNSLLDDIREVIKNAIVPAFSQPLDDNDPDSTAVKLFNDAWQSFSKGDEGLADEEQKAKWERERELLGGDVLAGKITDGIWAEALMLNTDRYPALAELLSQRVVDENKKGIISITTDNPGAFMLPAISNLLGAGDLDSLSAFIRMASTLNMLSPENPIPPSLVKPLTDKIVDLHEVMTTDNNIKHDNTWDFQMVRFDANGGIVGQTHALTVEDHRLIILPTPNEREGYTFDGWFTSETGGRQIASGDDMTGINTLYAHWTYVGEDKEDEDTDDEDVKPEPSKPDDQDTGDESIPELSDDTDGDVTPVNPVVTKLGGTTKERSVSGHSASGNRKTFDLHDYFVSRKALHDKIYNVEYGDSEHEKFCAAFVSALKKGETVFNMGSWLSLDADAAAAIEDCGKDVTLEYVGQGIGFRVLIPAGSKISRFADDHGSVCVVCLAESYGYERIGADEVLRQPFV